jgi:hypothetical protein
MGDHWNGQGHERHGVSDNDRMSGSDSEEVRGRADEVDEFDEVTEDQDDEDIDDIDDEEEPTF